MDMPLVHACQQVHASNLHSVEPIPSACVRWMSYKCSHSFLLPIILLLHLHSCLAVVCCLPIFLCSLAGAAVLLLLLLHRPSFCLCS